MSKMYKLIIVLIMCCGCGVSHKKANLYHTEIDGIHYSFLNIKGKDVRTWQDIVWNDSIKMARAYEITQIAIDSFNVRPPKGY